MADTKATETAKPAKTEEKGTAVSISTLASVKTLQAVATQEAKLALMAKVKAIKVLTMPVLKLEQNEPVFITVIGPMFEGKDIEGKRKGDPDAKIAILMNVTDLLDGGQKQVVVPAVIEGNLRDAYPNEGYVGKSFAILKGEKVPGKRYFNYNLAEIDPASLA